MNPTTVPGPIDGAARKTATATRLRIGALLLVGTAALGVASWLTDFFTLQGEWTLYGVTCEAGVWSGGRCNGSMRAGERFRFRALRAHREVLFWTVGASSPPSGKLTGCTIRDGRTWTCPPQDGVPRPVTFQLAAGEPVLAASDDQAAPHFVRKWRWLLLGKSKPAVN